jgi:hypothetical protein
MRLLQPFLYQLIKFKLPAVAAAKLFLQIVQVTVTQKSSTRCYYKLRMLSVEGFTILKIQSKLPNLFCESQSHWALLRLSIMSINKLTNSSDFMLPHSFPITTVFFQCPKFFKYRSYVTFAPTNMPPVPGAIYESDKSNSIGASHSRAVQLLINYMCSDGS